jgi:HEAT repeat protein
MLELEPPVPTGQTSRAARRQAARRVLEAFDPGAVDRWASAEPQAPQLMQSLLFDADDLVSWRAVEALGRTAAVRARHDLEGVREMLRRILWLMNDESGGLLWKGPAALGAVLANVPALCGEFLDVLASFLEEEPFRTGSRWALWRIARERPQAVAAAARAALAASLADADAAVRGHAALALSAASGPAAAAALSGDGAALEVFDYRSGTLRATTVGDVARGAF